MKGWKPIAPHRGSDRPKHSARVYINDAACSIAISRDLWKKVGKPERCVVYENQDKTGLLRVTFPENGEVEEARGCKGGAFFLPPPVVEQHVEVNRTDVVASHDHGAIIIDLRAKVPAK